ncbi:Fic family protein [Ottowia pentelensis]|uniref:Fic family protein n=1 Tax=Ottowia pentelensis TaxID=511108 RepID=A0ABV6PXF5_9BURK|nr:Fic family protein [Ottowia sp.]MBS0403768.1 Fic family protein [Pseudomonadota bacterium]MBS0414079.1 Fic family protein [Pseudomonadota bacterium]
MSRGEKIYLWQLTDWPALECVSRAQGLLAGRLADVGLAAQGQASLAALTEDVVKTSAIEGEALPVASVRSSIARRLGVDIGALAPVDRHVEGVVAMVLDATGRCDAPLSAERLFGWHAALFPTGYSGVARICVGAWRDDAAGPMEVVSGPVQRQRVHFVAPPATRLAQEMDNFLAWVNAPTGEPGLIKAGLAHLWLVTLHPFDDGNGRIARAVGDLLLARADGMAPQRYYSLSAQIQRERKAYYEILERTQTVTRADALDVTPWLTWFLAALERAVASAHDGLDAVLAKARFWQRWAGTPMNPRQTQMLNRWFDGFEGKLSSSKWAAMTKSSPDTALRDINELMALGVLRKLEGGGRSTAYELVAG